jgi:hypothetical protein
MLAVGIISNKKKNKREIRQEVEITRSERRMKNIRRKEEEPKEVIIPKTDEITENKKE